MAEGVLKIATCQFAVGRSIKRNAGQVSNFVRRAAAEGADVVHFSECALSGYVGTDFATFEGYDWALLKEETEKIMSLAAEVGIWVILGSTHRLTEPNRPHNSLYVINPDGEIAGRYDKRFCTEGDLKRLTPGVRFANFVVNGVTCSVLICFDLRFPEIYRQLRKDGVDCILQSFYNARQKGPSVHTDIMRQSMQCRAATNYFWVSMSNASGRYAPYPSCFIRPDGKIVRQLGSNKAGMMVNLVDVGQRFYDPSADFRDMAMKGLLSNGPVVIDDERSKNTTSL